MAIEIGARAQNDFTNPLGLLSDCHRRIEYFLGLLVTVTKQAQGSALSPEQHKALEVASFYFEQAAPRHTLDEEESLFPRLRASTCAQSHAAFALLDSLHAEHEVADEVHNQVGLLVRQWLKEGNLSSRQTHRLSDMLDELSSIYRKHIAAEDNELFPLAARILDESEILAVGREMAARRSINLETLATKLEG